jgi:hypothetical protein
MQASRMLVVTRDVVCEVGGRWKRGGEEKQREAAARGAAIQTIVADAERRLQAADDTD